MSNENPKIQEVAGCRPDADGSPDWKRIAFMLVRQCEFALTKLKADGWTGNLLDTSGAEITSIHWKDAMADVLDSIPGVKVNRDLMHGRKPSKPKKKTKRENAERSGPAAQDSASTLP